MKRIGQRIGQSFWELLFQLVLHALVFVFYSFDRQAPFVIKEASVVFFLNYALAAFLINFVLLRRTLYQKKYLAFFGGLLLIFTLAMLVEESILEPIYYPDTRGSRFPGVLFTLTQVLPVIVILSGFKFAWDALVRQRKVEELQSAVMESELQFLKSQINPHFLFNSLNNLYSYAIEQSPKTPDIILELSGVLRYVLYECREKYVPVSREIEQLKNLIQLSEMQIEERGEVRFSVHHIEPGYQIAPLILMVFVENAFKHSTASQEGAIRIQVDVALPNTGVLEFTCQNSYRAHSNTQQLAQGIGLDNVRKRLQLLYPNAHELHIHAQEDQYSVSLRMDLTSSL